MAPATAVEIPVGAGAVHGDLALPEGALGLAVFAHGSGSSRHSPRNRQVADHLRRRRLGTLLVDLLTEGEEAVDLRTTAHRFDIGLLSGRLVTVVEWLDGREDLAGLPVGYFGASTGAAAALAAAAGQGDRIGAVVSRGGRPDLAGEALETVRAPTLLVVGGADATVLRLNEGAQERMRCLSRLEVVPGATHLFEEAGALERVAELAADWLSRHLSEWARR